MEEQSPDAEEHGWLAMSLRRLNQTLVDQGLPSNPELIRRLLTS